MKNIKSSCIILLAFLLVAFISGCGGSGGSGGSGGGSTGLLTVALTDSPVTDAAHVVVEFTGVEVQSSSGTRTRFDFTPPRQIDLLALNGGGSEIILDQVTLPSGRYEWMRLMVNADCGTFESYLVDTNQVPHSLHIPSGAQTGLKLVNGFVVPAGGEANFTIDFDLRKSVNHPEGNGNCAGDYKLKPALRMVDNNTVGRIEGTINLNLVNDPSCTGGNALAVYAFDGAYVVPDDIDAILPNPVATVNAVDTDADGIYPYKLAFLSPGDYTIAFTCKAQNDLPDQDDNIVFLGTSNVTVNSGSTTIHIF
jgi:hypothetical protein